MRKKLIAILAIAVFLAVVAPSTSTAADLADHHSCGTVVPTETSCKPWKDCWSRLWGQRLYAALDAPNDVGPNLAWRALSYGAPFGDERALVYYYRSRASREPDSAAAQYLAARAENNAARIANFHAASLEADPDFAPAHLGVIHALQLLEYGKEEWEKKYPPAFHLQRYAELCPTRVVEMLSFPDYGDAEFWKKALPDARERIMQHEMPRGLERFATALGQLEALELRLYGTGAPDSDIDLIRSLIGQHPDEVVLYDLMIDAMKTRGDDQAVDAAEDEVISRFPCGAGASLRIERWHEEHEGFKRPTEMALSEAREYRSELLALISDCGNPDEMERVMLYGLLEANRRLLPVLDAAELEEARILQELWWQRVHSHFNLYVTDGHAPLYHYGREFLARGMEPEWVLEVAREEAGWIEKFRIAPFWETERPGIEKLRSAYLLSQDVETQSFLAEALLANGKEEEALGALRQIHPSVEKLSVLDVELHAVRMASAQSYYWLVRGMTAEEAGDSVASKKYYLKAAGLLPPEGHYLRDRRVESTLARLDLELPKSVLASATTATVWQDLEPVILPEFKLRTNQGKEWTQNDLEQVVLLHVWSTGCGFCRAEHPYLQKLLEEGYSIVGLGLNENPGVASNYLAEYGYTFPSLLSAGPVVDRIAGRVNRGNANTPTNWIVVRDAIGRYHVVAEQHGFPGSQAESWLENTRQALDQHLKEK